MGSRLEGKVVLVTGASRGIGEAIAKAVAAEGATVFCGARDEAKLAAVVSAITASGGKAEAVTLDVESRPSVAAAFEKLLGAHERIDGLVNNAGIARDNIVLRMKAEEWDAVLRTNLTGVFHCTQAALRPMLKQRGGRIVNLTSLVGIEGAVGQANYAASKAGVIGFTKSVAKEMATRSITVNAVAPGFIETEMTAAMTDRAKEFVISRIPMGRTGLPADVAGAVLFLLSDAAAYITGQVLQVDGGYRM